MCATRHFRKIMHLKRIYGYTRVKSHSIVICVTRNLPLVTHFETIYGHTAVRNHLTHWGRVTHICVSKLSIVGSDNGLPSGRRQAIIWTNAGILLIGPLGTKFNEILIEIHTFSFKKMLLKVSSAKRRTFCLGLNVLNAMYVRSYLHTNLI